MLYIDYRKTFERTPNLRVLWEMMLQLSIEYRGLTLISDKPFLIDNYGRVSGDSLGGMALALHEYTEDRVILWNELLILERLLRERSIHEEEVIAIDERSTALPRVIEAIRGISDVNLAARLNEMNALN